MLIDLHVHTLKSADSSLSPEEMVREAKRVGLDGVCLTEHGGGWDRHDFERLASRYDMLLIPALEVDTDMGHIAVFGADGYAPGMSKASDLRRIVDASGGFMVVTHPFRRMFDRAAGRNLLFPDADGQTMTARQAAEHPVFQLVDDVEVGNGANTLRENDLAREVADALGKRGTGGSDAHSTHGLGCFVTSFERNVRCVAELVEELRAGRYTPAQGLLQGKLRPLTTDGHKALA